MAAVDAFARPPPHSQHPDFGHLVLLVFEAVLEVVCVSAPGYIIARMGQMDANAQKFIANLNVMLFTPCLIFTKLASQLTADKLVDLAVIPLIFIVQTIVSYLSAYAMSKLFRFKKRPSNFVIAMGVFGNSNSLPISLVISLSKTLSGLHWDKVPGDNDEEVAARGILYLLIFQQLGQLVRWSWGYHVLLAPPDKYSEEEGGRGLENDIESGHYQDHPSLDERRELLADVSDDEEHNTPSKKRKDHSPVSDSDYESGSATPINQSQYIQSPSLDGTDEDDEPDFSLPQPANGHVSQRRPFDPRMESSGHITHFPNPSPEHTFQEPNHKGLKGSWTSLKKALEQSKHRCSSKFSAASKRSFDSLPSWLQVALSKISRVSGKFLNGLWEFMNPPLWAMLAAVLVASIPQLQHLFFDKGTFISNSVSRAVHQSGQVAVPLILVVLGANLARNTLPKEAKEEGGDPKEERNLLIAALVSRMLLPTIIMAPMLALMAKYVPVSILDDPIFVIVCFLLTGAPSALQLAQICQINGVYMGAMSRLLFQSYVIWLGTLLRITPSNVGVPRNERKSPSFPTNLPGMPVVVISQPLCSSLDFIDSDTSKRLSGRASVTPNWNELSMTSDGTPTESSARRSRGSNETNLISQISSWLRDEKTRRHSAKAKSKSKRADTDGSGDGDGVRAERRGSDASEGSTALEKLQAILDNNASALAEMGEQVSRSRKSSCGPRRVSSIRKLRRTSTAGSDTDYVDGEPVVPNVEAILDNSKTLSYTGGGAESSEDTAIDESKRKDDTACWLTFKYEIVRLTHTLRLKGWRRVLMEKSGEIEVERLTGALTNAVYVVSPPKDLPPKSPRPGQSGDTVRPNNPPPKLLLRIYGTNVDALIDRASELAILQRLARKRIGPRLLGTFTNGRFEEFFHARTLTCKDLRVPDTSKQIAKRMRELHDGIDLLPREREAGPFVWQNWDKWVVRCGEIARWMDGKSRKGELKGVGGGFVCGAEWDVFEQAVAKYRKWLEDQYGGYDKVKEKLVFAHNDTQYGNILRLIPPGASPLLLPANEHKQLVVIDFEYASANVSGLEFANHFTEWCYNYHDSTVPHGCNIKMYPTQDEQRRFIEAYVRHHPSFKSGGGRSGSSTPGMRPTTPGSGATTAGGAGSSSGTGLLSSSNSISNFMLDSRAPPGGGQQQSGSNYNYQAVEAAEEEAVDLEVKRLMEETRLWRTANSAQWVAWGIMQAKVPGMPASAPPTPGVQGPIHEESEAEGRLHHLAEKLHLTHSKTKEGKEEEKEKGEKHHHIQPNEGTDPLEGEEVDLAKDAKDKRPDGSYERMGVMGDEEDEEFDYVNYARERAMFFWGDLVTRGLMKEEELPKGVREEIKIVSI
ncbi:kinase-like protein [Aulographum hederae CBS 113979]|uniref:Kinase-like protein n=1 Tax=Aulographum hederae CBS 113979 TaxID=1176131 RepID=A0A6G1H0U0_9PEZI|nr:kinase-like protein [Aulographum hederae CBS 113979]